MAIFAYRAAAPDIKKPTTGQMVAESMEALTEKLRAQNLTLVTAKEVDPQAKGFNGWLERFQGVPAVQKIFFTQNLGVMLRGGFSISRALGTLSLQTSHAYFKKVLLGLQQDVEGGMGFAQALGKFPTVFPEMFVNMVAAGEISGKLDDVLHSLTVQMKKDRALTGKVKGAMAYPIVVVIAMIGVGIAMIVFVIPKLADVFAASGSQLPLPTRILIWLSNAAQHQGILIALGVIAVIAAFMWYQRTPGGKKVLDTVYLSAPILGPIMKKINLARFTRSLSSMLATDIPIIQAFQVIAKTLGSTHYRQSIEDSSQALKTGAPIANVLQHYPKLYPPLVQQMIGVGEESGTLDDIAGELATFFEEDVDQTMSNLSTIIEPVILLVLGVAVAGMAVAILLPMYNLTNVIN